MKRTPKKQRVTTKIAGGNMPDPESARSAFDRFASLTKALVAIPKKEITRKARAYQRKRLAG